MNSDIYWEAWRRLREGHYQHDIAADLGIN